MALQQQNVPLSLNQGLDTKSDKKQVAFGKFTTLENATFTTLGQLTKRNGYDQLDNHVLTTGTSISKSNAIASYNSSTVLMDGESVYSYSPGEVLNSQNAWVFNGYKQAISVSAETIGSNALGSGGQFVTPVSVLSSDGIQFIAWHGQQTLFYSYYDTNKGVVIAQGQILTTGALPSPNGLMVFEGTSNYYVIYSDSVTNQIYYVPFTKGAPTVVTGPTLLLTTASGISKFDLITFNNKVYLMYAAVTTSFPTIVVYDLSMSFQSSTTVENAVVANFGLSSDTVANRIFTAYTTTTPALKIAMYTSAMSVLDTKTITTSGLTPVFANTNGAFGITFDLDGTSVNGAYWIYYSYTTSVNNRERLVRAFYDPTTTGTGIRHMFYDLRVAAKPFTKDNRIFLLTYMHLSDNQQSTYILLKDFLSTDVYTGNINYEFVARSTNQMAPYLTLNYNIPTINVVTDGEEYLFPGAVQVQSRVAGGSTTYNYNLQNITFTFDKKISTISLGKDLIMSGGVISSFDGVGIAENGFHNYPQSPVLGTNTSGSIPAGTYSYVTTYEWVDAVGNKFRSAPSNPLTVTYGSVASQEFGVKSLEVTTAYKYSNVVINLYRTLGSGSTQYYLVASVSQSTTPSSGGNYTILDNINNTALSTSTQLYTNGGEIENIIPNASDTIISFKNRAITIPSENGYTWQYSKQVIQGFPAEFNDTFIQQMDQRGGQLTALGVMDDKLVLFKERAIFIIYGDGPASNGTQDNFTFPQFVNTDVGCGQPESIVSTPAGTLFKSHKGIYLLARDLGVSYIGAPVEAYNNANITCAVLIDNTTQIRFGLDTGVILHFDYFVNQWSTFTSQLVAFNAKDSMINGDGNYTICRSDGTVWVENSTKYTDGLGAPYQMKGITSWISFANIQNYQRVRELLFLGSISSTENTLTFNFAYDFEDTDTPVSTITLTSEDPTQRQVYLPRQKCESVRITFTDDGLAGGSLELSNFNFTMGIKVGHAKLAASKSVG